MKAIRTNLVINSIRSHKDHSIGFSADTPELTDEQRNVFFSLHGINSDALIAPQDEPEAEVVKVSKEIKTKSQGQRIRAVIFLLWKQSGEKEPFETFYFNKTEKIINYLKEQLDE